MSKNRTTPWRRTTRSIRGEQRDVWVRWFHGNEQIKISEPKRPEHPFDESDELDKLEAKQQIGLKLTTQQRAEKARLIAQERNSAIKYAQERKGFDQDCHNTSKTVNSRATKSWQSDPGSSDVKGVDTKQFATQCRAVNVNGTRCQNTTMNDSNFCHFHNN